jgi:hypothetical protein
MSDHDQMTTQQHYDDPELDWYEDDAEGEDAQEDAVPRRPKRRLVTPVTGALAAVVLVAGGFIGGVQVQKHQGSGTSSGGGRAGGFAARFGGGQTPGGGTSSQGGGGASGAAGGSGASNATTGTVANVKGSTIYLTTSDGTTVKIRTNDTSRVTRNASAEASSIHPGDTLVVQGARASSGTVTASSITATARGVSAFGGLAAFGGGGGAAPGSGTSGTSSSGSSSSGGASIPQGFAPPAG